MGRQPDDSVEEEQPAVSRTWDAPSGYRRLLASLAARARWLGSRDAEGSAQEALRRSLENPNSKPAVEYYFSQVQPAGLGPPEWPLDQFLAWLHGVIYYVVLEEHHRVSSRREVPLNEIASEEPDGNGYMNFADPMPNQLDALIQRELHRIVLDCFPRLEREYRDVLSLRAEGLKYSEIAIRLGVNVNTVATWVNRGMKTLARCVRRRTGGLARQAQARGQGIRHD